MGWLTGDIPPSGDFTCRRLRIPNTRELIAAVQGAIDDMAWTLNWEQTGTLSPLAAQVLMLKMFEDFITPGDWCMLGSIFPFASALVPSHCLECDGATYLRTSYPALYASLDLAFIVDADNFVVPDLRQRIPLGSDSPEFSLYPPGAVGGEASHVLTVAELASHGHLDSGHTHPEGTTAPTVITIGAGAPVPSAVGTSGSTGSSTANISNTGGDAPHNNLQPFIALRYAIVSE